MYPFVEVKSIAHIHALLVRQVAAGLQATYLPSLGVALRLPVDKAEAQGGGNNPERYKETKYVTYFVCDNL